MPGWTPPAEGLCTAPRSRLGAGCWGLKKHLGMAAMISWDAVLGSRVHQVIAAPREGTPDVLRRDGRGFLSGFYLLVNQETVLVRKCN